MYLDEEFRTLPRVERDPFSIFNPLHSSSNSSYDLENEDAIILTRRVAYKIIAPIIVSSGLLGNVLTIIILRNPVFKGVTYNFFFALALFDFLSLIFSISALEHLLHPITQSYATAVWYSYCEILLINTFMGTSVLIVVCITFDRYMSACHPFTFKTFHTDKYCRLGIYCSFALSFLVWLPTCFLKKPYLVTECPTFYYIYEFENSTGWISCQTIDPSVNKWYNVYSWIRETLISFLPIVIVIILNCLLFKYFVEKHNQNARRQSSQVTNAGNAFSSRQIADNNLKSLLKAIIISFLITILPAGVFNAAYSQRLSRNFKYEIFRATANNLELLNHALNFYLYILISKPVRSALPSLLENTKIQVADIFNFAKRRTSSKKGSVDFSKESKSVTRSNKEQIENKREQSKTDSRQTQSSEITNESNPLELEKVSKDASDKKVPCESMKSYINACIEEEEGESGKVFEMQKSTKEDIENKIQLEKVQEIPEYKVTHYNNKNSGTCKL